MDKKGLENRITKAAEGTEGMTNRDIMNIIMHDVHGMDSMVKSVDERERILQKLFAQLSQKVDDFIAENRRNDVIKREGKRDKGDWQRWAGLIVVTAVVFFLGVVVNHFIHW